MMDIDASNRFAREWVQAWNDHDLDAILAHYAEDVVFHSPRIEMVTGQEIASVAGKAALRAYWGAALESARDLFFELDQVFAGSDALTIVYTNHRQQAVAETFVFDASSKVTKSIATYAA